MYKRLTLALCAVIAFCAFQSCDDDDRYSNKVDPAFTQALEQLKPNLKSVEWKENRGYLVAEGREGNYDVSVWFTSDVKWAMTETEYNQDVNQLPQAVTNTIQASPDYGTWTVDDIDFYERPDISFYVVELESPQATELYVYITPAGNILKTTPRDEEVTPVTSFLTPAM
ncbi:MAG: PepSY-like domain-containing protein [Paramuribaculum sp.]|nr:PepSY-like domain-containing protein [Paramuribaculum sp.]